MFRYSYNNKRYHTLDYFYKTTFNEKICKLCFNIGCSCPNVDGTKGFGGCIYCKNGSGDFAGDKNVSLKEQYNSQRKIMERKWPNASFIAYFQAGSNTYGDLEYLKKCYLEVLSFEKIKGLYIATRCDCLSADCLEFLKLLNKKTNLVIELGLQTIHDSTSKLINRGHTQEEFIEAFKMLKANDIKVVVHIINGLPYENKEMMIETAKFLNDLKVDGIKIHMLAILKDTKMAKLYEKEKFPLLTKEEYIDIVISQLEYLDPNIVIHRVTTDPNINDLIAPKWLVKKTVLLNDIDKEMKRRNTYQGIKNI